MEFYFIKYNLCRARCQENDGKTNRKPPPKGISIASILSALINGHYHMCYLYMLIGLYLATPFFRAFVKKENKNLILFFLLLALVSQFTRPIIDILSSRVTIFKEVSEFINKFYLQFFGGFAAYYLAGWYIVHIGISKRWARGVLYAAGAISLAAMLLLSQITGANGDAFSNMNFFVFLYAASTFLFLNRVKIHAGSKTKRILTAASRMTFGIYIIHPFFQEMLSKMFPYEKLPILYILVSFLVFVLLSLGVTFILSKLTLLKKTVRM